MNIKNPDLVPEVKQYLEEKHKEGSAKAKLPLCRLCCKELVGEGCAEATKEIADLAFFYMKIPLLPEEKKLPRTVCDTCGSTLRNFHQFVKDCVLQQENWLSYFQQKNKLIKSTKVSRTKAATPLVEEEPPAASHAVYMEEEIDENSLDADFENYENQAEAEVNEEQLDNQGDIIEEDDTQELESDEVTEDETETRRSTTTRSGKIKYIPVIHTCEICAYSFETFQELRAHIRTYHTVSSSEVSRLQGRTCPICSVVCRLIPLGEHMREKHPDQMPQCDICSRVFTTHKMLMHHHERVHRSKPCPKCNKIYSKQALASHIKTCGVDFEKIDQITCEICGRRCRTQAIYRRHVNDRHDTSDPKFTCDTCGKQFRRKERYIDHINYHQGLYPYECEWCGRRFTFNSNFYTHRRQKHPEEYQKYVEERDKARLQKMQMEDEYAKKLQEKSKQLKR